MSVVTVTHYPDVVQGVELGGDPGFTGDWQLTGTFDTIDGLGYRFQIVSGTPTEPDAIALSSYFFNRVPRPSANAQIVSAEVRVDVSGAPLGGEEPVKSLRSGTGQVMGTNWITGPAKTYFPGTDGVAAIDLLSDLSVFVYMVGPAPGGGLHVAEGTIDRVSITWTFQIGGLALELVEVDSYFLPRTPVGGVAPRPDLAPGEGDPAFQ